MVEILLATYNGCLYIEELLQSLIAQDYDEWICTISDDGSTDATINIVKKYIEKYPGYFRLLNLLLVHNAKNNFLNLLKNSTADYIMFCDQDDVWLPKKISTMIKEIEKRELKNENSPILVFSDHIVANQNLELIADSFINYSGYDSTRIHLNQLILENIISGCSCILNRSLAERANMYKNKEAIRWHDWWVALTAASTGKIYFINESLTLYRQHENNTVGVISSSGIKSSFERFSRLSYEAYRTTHNVIIKQIRQAQELKNIEGIKDEWVPLIKDLVEIEKMNKIQRILCLFRYRICRNKRTIWTYFCV